MASADYKLCGVCNAKTFYDSNIEYDHSRYEYEGVGSCVALCMKCNEKWELQIVKKENKR